MSKAILYAKPSLAEKRKERGWTQEQFATLLTLESGEGVSKSLVEKWERRARTINAEMVLEIAKALRVSDVREIIDQENL
jgi:transcriptional regulator with XRE-family HTH domain